MDRFQGIYHLPWRSFFQMRRYAIAIVVCILFSGGLITPTRAFESSTIDAIRLGDQVTSDLLEEIKAFQAILNQPISLGVLVRRGQGPAGGSTKRNKQGSVGENNSPGFEKRFGQTGHRGKPGTSGFQRIYGVWSNYRGANYANEDNVTVQQKSYATDQYLSTGTKVACEDEKVWFGCKQNEKINITDAFWGRDDFVTCSQSAPSNHTTRQWRLDNDVGHVVTKVKEICNRRPVCEFFATRMLFDDVSNSRVYKYLRVAYECVK